MTISTLHQPEERPPVSAMVSRGPGSDPRGAHGARDRQLHENNSGRTSAQSLSFQQNLKEGGSQQRLGEGGGPLGSMTLG